jgi:hypothetical protein
MWQLQWMLNLIPDSIVVSITYLLFAAGVVLYVASKLVKWIPMIGSYTLLMELVGVVLLTVAAYFVGGHDTRSAWQARIKDLEQQVAAAETQSAQVNTVIETRVVEKVKVVKQNVYINKEIIREVAGAQLDATCTLPRSSVVLHDSASGNQVADRAAATDGTPSGIEAHRLLETVVENYGACHENADKLKAWQAWYREQKIIFESIK